jgi:hypothetical protein
MLLISIIILIILVCFQIALNIEHLTCRHNKPVTAQPQAPAPVTAQPQAPAPAPAVISQFTLPPLETGPPGYKTVRRTNIIIDSRDPILSLLDKPNPFNRHDGVSPWIAGKPFYMIISTEGNCETLLASIDPITSRITLTDDHRLATKFVASVVSLNHFFSYPVKPPEDKWKNLYNRATSFDIGLYDNPSLKFVYDSGKMLLKAVPHGSTFRGEFHFYVHPHNNVFPLSMYPSEYAILFGKTIQTNDFKSVINTDSRVSTMDNAKKGIETTESRNTKMGIIDKGSCFAQGTIKTTITTKLQQDQGEEKMFDIAEFRGTCLYKTKYHRVTLGTLAHHRLHVEVSGNPFFGIMQENIDIEIRNRNSVVPIKGLHPELDCAPGYVDLTKDDPIYFCADDIHRPIILRTIYA